MKIDDSGVNRSLRCIIIVNWNCIDDTVVCANRLKSSNWTIIVVDNGSDDLSEVDRMRKALPDAVVIKSEKNLGYAGGMNIGMKFAREHGYSYAMLINPDTMPDMEWALEMFRVGSSAAVVGTSQVSPDANANMVVRVAAANLNGRKPIPLDVNTLHGNIANVDIVSGAALVLDLVVADKLDYFDERFFHYKEEYDYCFRARRSGYALKYILKPPLVHHKGGSLETTSPMAAYYWYRNELLFMCKHYGRFGWVYAPGIFKQCIGAALQSPDHAKAVLFAIVDGIMGRSGPLPPQKRLALTGP